MIRKIIIVDLTLATVGVLALWLHSMRIYNVGGQPWNIMPILLTGESFFEETGFQWFVRLSDDCDLYVNTSRRRLEICHLRDVAPSFQAAERNLSWGSFAYWHFVVNRSVADPRKWPMGSSGPVSPMMMKPRKWKDWAEEQRQRWQRPDLLAWSVSAPSWALFILFAAYPTIAFIRGPLRCRRRRRKGWCLKCGYDLTGNVSGVCPECGSSR